jgi:hypothetical protein
VSTAAGAISATADDCGGPVGDPEIAIVVEVSDVSGSQPNVAVAGRVVDAVVPNHLHGQRINIVPSVVRSV